MMPAPLIEQLPPRVRERPALPANATLVGCQPLTPEVRLLRVRRDGGAAPFIAGQYVSLGLWHEGSWLQRPYSPAAVWADGQVELLVRLVDGGQLTPLLWTTPLGARLRLGPAKGIFRLEAGDRRTHLFLGTGTGIAPLVAMAGSLLAESDPPPIILLHGVRHRADLAYRDRLEAWAAGTPRIVYVPTASRSAPRNAIRDEPRGELRGIVSGRATDVLPRVWARLGLEPAKVVAYLCGNPAVVAGTARWLASQGLEPAAIRREEYWPAA